MPSLTDIAVVLEAAAQQLRLEDADKDVRQKADEVLRLKLKQMAARIAALEGTAPVVPIPGPEPGGGSDVLAEGFGSIATGGTGKPIHTVTNLNANGAGSLRDAVSVGNRFITFTVGGTINLASEIYVRGMNITVDGLSAPAPGITLSGGGLIVNGSAGAGNVIVQGIRSRSSPGDAFAAYDVATVMFDRCSASGYGDGAFDVTEGSVDVTVQWCLMGEAPPVHDFPILIFSGAKRVSVHHNLFFRGDSRFPRVDGSALPAGGEVTADVRNNLIWDFRNSGTDVDNFSRANVINNYYWTSYGVSDAATIRCDANSEAYVAGNVSQNSLTLNDNGTSGAEHAVSLAPVTTDALTAAHAVLAGAGARGTNALDPFGLDATDQLIVAAITTLPAEGGGGGVAGQTFEVNFADLGSGQASLVPTVGAISATFTRASAGTAVLVTGLLKTDVATDVARVWHDPTTLSHLGVMIEGARTNLCLQSENLGTTWTNTESTESLNATTAPDNAATADKLVEAATTNIHEINQSITKAASALQYTWSDFSKAAQVTVMRLLPRDLSKYAGSYVNVSTGVVGSELTTTWTRQQFLTKAHPSAWYRVQDTFTTDTGTLVNMTVRLAQTNETTNYLGNTANGAYLWGSQLELGAFASSYVPTTTAAVTRAKDSLTYPISTLLGGTENTYFVSARTAPGSGTQTFLSIDDGTANERVTIQRNTSNEVHCLVVDGGSTVADLNLGVIADDTGVRVALRVKAGDFAASLNGGSVITDAAGALPTVTTLRVGQDHGNVNEAFGPIKKVMQYATGLTNAELVTLAA